MNANRIPRIAALGLVAAFSTLLSVATAAEGDPAPESVTIQNGVLMVKMDGKLIVQTNEVVFPGEIIVQTNATFTVHGGKDRSLSEGQILSAEGMLTKPDGSIVPVEDHIILKRGQAYLVINGESSPISGQYTLKNGNRLSPDGKMITPRNRVERLLDGQIVLLKDSSIESTDTAQLEKGKVVLYKDGSRIELRPNQTMVMSDGSRVNGSGYVVKPDGSRVALREGDLLKFPGAGNSPR